MSVFGIFFEGILYSIPLRKGFNATFMPSAINRVRETSCF